MGWHIEFGCSHEWVIFNCASIKDQKVCGSFDQSRYSFLSLLLSFSFLWFFFFSWCWSLLWFFFLGGWLGSFLWVFLLGGWLGWSWLLLFFNNWSWGWISSLFGSLLFLKIFGEELFISDVSFLALLPSINSRSLVEDLSSNSLLSNESLDLWWFVESLFSSVFAGSSMVVSGNNVLSNIVLFSKNESSSNVRGSLWSESSWSFLIGKSWDFSFTLDQYFEGNNWKVWATDASSSWLSLSFSSSSWSVEGSSYLK